jgi:hypothetical protein
VSGHTALLCLRGVLVFGQAIIDQLRLLKPVDVLEVLRWVCPLVTSWTRWCLAAWCLAGCTSVCACHAHLVFRQLPLYYLPPVRPACRFLVENGVLLDHVVAVPFNGIQLASAYKEGVYALPAPASSGRVSTLLTRERLRSLSGAARLDFSVCRRERSMGAYRTLCWRGHPLARAPPHPPSLFPVASVSPPPTLRTGRHYLHSPQRWRPRDAVQRRK